ncbi:MAG: S-adenosylmethionine:tRNA ribosyltransferase-isomerase [Muribaculaceae bacterium]|nr:S-adenosylmethionine:tRNA ribosyltransferase-isomerase [Muribaculaceae bacterium]
MTPQDISIADFFYDLPDDRIAKHPLARRDSCRLLARRSDGTIQDFHMTDIVGMVAPGTMMVSNNTRVINARLKFAKPTGGIIEVFCLEPVSPVDYEQCFASTGPVAWRCFVGNSKRWKDAPLRGIITIDGQQVILNARRLHKLDGESIVEFSWHDEGGQITDYTFGQVIASAGVIPIPPYLNRETEPADLDDYQTVFARVEGSVAAPTAGLHFTPELLRALDDRGVIRREVTLHVGAGTFQPVKGQYIGEHPMHSEFIVVERSLIEDIRNHEGGVLAIGTTSVRTLESIYHVGCLLSQGRWDGEVPQWYPYEDTHPDLTLKDAMDRVLDYLDASGSDRLVGTTRIIIAPGYKYRVVTSMVTNFHQPGSTLLLLVSAFIGDHWRSVYRHALEGDYRFLSYGDACYFTK